MTLRGAGIDPLERDTGAIPCPKHAIVISAEKGRQAQGDHSTGFQSGPFGGRVTTPADQHDKTIEKAPVDCYVESAN